MLKKKGGIKIHTVINDDEIVTSLDYDYTAFKLFSEQKTGFVTRIKDNAI